jgi:putative effector of murein hydrolase
METVNQMISSSLYFGFVLTISVYAIAVMINKKWNFSITTPLLLSTAGVIAVLMLLDIPYSSYAESSKYLGYFLTPAIVCFAVPMYRQAKLIRDYKWVVLFSILFGCLVSVLTVMGLCYLFGLDQIIMKSMVTVSTTAAIGIDITKELGGLIGFTVFATISTGILGNAVGRQVAGLFRFKNPAATGLAMGNSSHAAGTAKALEMGQVEGAFASLSIGISGVLTAIIAPMLIWALS